VRRVGGLARAIVVLTGLSVVGALVTSLLTPSAADRAAEFLAGDISEDEFLEGYAGIAIAQFGQGVGTLATAVLTMIWLYRLAANVRALGRDTTWAPLFAVFGWVLPPVLVVIPFLMVRELWKASEPFTTAGADEWRSTSDNPAIWVWFLLYGVLQTVLVAFQSNALLGSGFSNDPESLAESIDDSVTLSVVGGLSLAAAGVAWIVVVRQLTQKHVALTREG
jgi:hypothetical protein